MFSVASPSLCQAILQSRVAHVHKDIQVTMKPFLSILGTGMVTSEGPQWLRQRMQLSHSLRNDILERIPSHTLAAVQRLCVVLDKAAATASDAASVVPMGSLLRHLTLQVISGAFLSLSAGQSDAHFARLYLPIVDESNRRVWHPYRTYNVLSLDFWRYQMNVFRLNSYVCRLIRERWTLRRLEQDQEPQNNLGRVVEGIPAETSATAAACTAQRPWDILDRVLQFYEAHPKTSDSDNSSRKTMPRFLSPAVIRQVRDEMKTFMLAGHETSAAMMTWTLYELVCSQQPHQRPHMSSAAATTDSTKDKNITSCSWMDRVVAEADTVFLGAVDWGCSATAKDLPPLETLANLVLAEASLKVREQFKPVDILCWIVRFWLKRLMSR